jgi:hypothetical protein
LINSLRVVGGIITALGFLAPSVFAQRASVGIVVGGYFNRDFESRYQPGPSGVPDVVESDAGGYVIGPALELRLSESFALGVEALYKPLHYEDGVRFDQSGAVVGFAPNTVVTWQFPVLARYQFRQHNLRPFVEAGPSFRATGNLNRADPSHFGVGAGFGFAADLGRLQIAPTMRYTRWLEDGRRADVRAKQDQIELLVRFGYRQNSSLKPLGKRIALGAVVGATLSNDIRASNDRLTDGSAFQVSPAGPAPVVGPSIELMLTRRLAIEANAIPRSFRTTQRFLAPDGSVLSETRTNSGGTWEFPVLAKLRLRQQGLLPFVTVGPSFRLPKLTLPIHGGTVGLGFEAPLKGLRISPTVRYTRWASERRPAGIADSGVRRDQIRVLVGISF